jgi:hypothetical protein
MLGLLAPLLVAETGAVLASRGSDGGSERRGTSVSLEATELGGGGEVNPDLDPNPNPNPNLNSNPNPNPNPQQVRRRR